MTHDLKENIAVALDLEVKASSAEGGEHGIDRVKRPIDPSGLDIFRAFSEARGNIWWLVGQKSAPRQRRPASRE
jgi:hypothetical protein